MIPNQLLGCFKVFEYTISNHHHLILTLDLSIKKTNNGLIIESLRIHMTEYTHMYASLYCRLARAKKKKIGGPAIAINYNENPNFVILVIAYLLFDCSPTGGSGFPLRE